MELASFIQSLIKDGSVSVKGVLVDFTIDDLEQSKRVLEQYYHNDKLEMPYSAPAFSADAALWASTYLYTATQLTVLRDAGAQIVQERLKKFEGAINPAAIYSADLVLRYLPALFELSKGLAPADMLVQELQQTAAEWPFSSVGIGVHIVAQEEVIFSHPSLAQTYITRIIDRKDKTRLTTPEIESLILAAIGQYTDLWPGFTHIKQ